MPGYIDSAAWKDSIVFIVDDDAAICDGVCNLLESVNVRAERFGSAEEFMARWNPEIPGCLVLDARLPGMTGIAFQQHLIEAGIEIPIIFMTAHGDVPMVRKAMKAGAVEFLTKPFDKQELLTAVGQAFERDQGRRREQREIGTIRSRLSTLTPRELEVMEFVTTGALNKQIAAELGISEVTVKVYRRQVFEKMEADSLAELVKMSETLRVRGSI